MDYSKTVNLPKTGFKMKAGLSQKEPQFLKRWEKMGLYELQLEKRKQSPDYILHDGPPYANGEIHMGHALNKILKDIIIKYKFFRGYKTPYVPGWDCHGLPIELKVTSELGDAVKDMHILKLREKCRKYALKYVNLQKEGFKRLGIFGEWNNPYLTLSEDYEATILESFGKLAELGHVYRGQRPVYWSPDSVTALAEAEVEYHDHVSPSIYVKFPVEEHQVDKLDGKVSVMIWTTTPWTLPANTGLSFHPREKYTAVKINDEWVILASKLKSAVLQIKDLKAQDEVELTRDDLDKMKVKHLWIDRESTVVYGEHVTMDTGTGVVHTAPGHGMDDYIVGLANGLDILSPVDDYGQFTDEVPEWEGKKVLEVNDEILEFLDERGLLYHSEKFTHSYPHDWRTKTPVIFRSKPQWFFKVSDKNLAKKAIEELPKINWVPKWGEERIKNLLDERPDWCLSRQRNWGVPIPAFYCDDCGEAILNKETLGHITKIVKKDGIDVWYKKEAVDLLPENYKCPKCGGVHFSKETDILDVWFDSGVSSLAVLENREGLHTPADVYLEGTDQYRGWFQSSLWPSVAIKGFAPYKNVITNGWVLTEDGKQMHKSLGNAVSPKEVYDKFGADVLRLWVVTEDYTKDLRIGDNLIQKAVDAYRKIRNTFRYMLGNLNNFTPEKVLPYDELMDMDKYALASLYQLQARVEDFYDKFEFHRAFRDIHNFCVIELSNRALDILKDRLYIYGEDSKERLSGQTMLYYMLKNLMMMLVPILPFTMEEVYQRFFAENEEDTIHLQDWPELKDEWKNEELLNKFKTIMDIRDNVLKSLETLRNSGAIGTSLEAKVLIKPMNDEIKNLLNEYADDLRYYFIVSQTEIKDELDEVSYSDELVSVKVMKAEGKKCARCWNYSVEVGNDEVHPELCERCAPIVKEMKIEE